jgi:hypothetical protein
VKEVFRKYQEVSKTKIINFIFYYVYIVMSVRVHKNAFFFRELIFLLFSLLYYHKLFLGIFFSSPLEIAYFKTYSIGLPSNYFALWGDIDLYLKLHIYSALFLQKLVSLILLINSSYLIVDLLYRKIRNLTANTKYDFLLLISLSLLLSINPLFDTLYPIFGFSYLAFMNFALFFSLEIIISKANNIKIVLCLLAASFFLAFGTELYPLIIGFYLAIYICVILPIAFSLHKKARFLWVILAELFIFALTYPSFLGLFNLAKGSGSTLNSISTFHVTNLIFYIGSMFSPQTSKLFYSLSGVNSSYYSSSLSLAAVLILILIVLIIFLFNRDSLKLMRNLTASFIAVEILNLTVSGQSIVSFTIENLVSQHVFRTNYFGIILTLFAGNALILIVFWYILVSLLAVNFSVKVIDIKGINKGVKSVFKITRRLIKGSQFGIIVVLLIMLFQIGSSSVIQLNDAASWNYVQSSISPDYNQYLFFQNSTYFGNQYVYPPSYEMEPTANKFSFNEAVINAENSPYLNQIDKSFPASTILLSNSSHSEYLYNASELGSEYAMTNFNVSNVVSGSPVFVVGSASSYNSLVSDLARNTIPHSSSCIRMLSVPYGMNTSLVPVYDMALLDSGDYLSFAFNISINGSNIIQNVGSFNFGLDSNFSARGGYGLGNNFTGLGLNYGNISFSDVFSSESCFPQHYSGWTIDFSFTNSTVWHVPVEYTQFGKNITLSFNIVESKIANEYFVYVDISGKWYAISSYNLFPDEYLTMLNYNEPTRNISMSVNISAFNIDKTDNSLLPIFYDSPFASESALMNALNDSSMIVFEDGYNTEDLLFSYLLLQVGTQIIEPSSYSIDFPQNGWFQTFNSNSPQGAYYSENINPFLLPINFGYGPSIGYAEDVLRDSSLNVPVAQAIAGNDTVGINLLFSPMGGPLEVKAGNNLFSINTFSESSYYRWITLNLTSAVKSFNLTNIQGVQSVNLIASVPKTLFTSSESTINKILNAGHIVTLGKTTNLKASKNTSIVTGVFDSNKRINDLNLSGKHFPLVLLLPAPYSSRYLLRVYNASVKEIPVWGVFYGLLLTNQSGGKVTLELVNSSFYSGITIYSAPTLILTVVMVDRIIIRRRKKK